MNKILQIALLCFTVIGAFSHAAAQTHTYMLLHNLGCRQSNHTYNGYIYYNEFDEGDLVEVILAGPNGLIDPPLADGSPGGDDQQAVNPGLPFAMNPESFTHYHDTFYSPNAILISSSGSGPEPALHAGSAFYVRAWNGPSPASSTRYFNSATLTRDFPVGAESCPYHASVRTLPIQLLLPNLISYAVTFDTGHPYSAPMSLEAIQPNGGEQFFTDSIMTILWTSSSPVTSVDLLLSRDSGDTWEYLYEDLENENEATWLIAGSNSPDCLIRIQAATDTTIYDQSDQAFSISTMIIPDPPEIALNVNMDLLTIRWKSREGAGRYFLEQSDNLSDWDSLTIQEDTTYSIILDSIVDSSKFFRCTCIP